MLQKIILLFAAAATAFAINLQTASKAELMQIKGIGEKKAEAIVKYRKTHKLKSADDLKKIKGFGDKLISNVKHNEKNGKKSSKKVVKKKKKTKKVHKKQIKK